MMNPEFLQPSEDFRQQHRFEAWAQALIRLPEAGEGPVDHLLPEADWQLLLKQASDPEDWLAAVSRTTGIYFFPSREWPTRLLRWLKQVRAPRLLEAGAGRGYLTAALEPLAAAAGLAFQAVDRGQGEFVSSLPLHPAVTRGDVFTEIHRFLPDAVLYGWPPPGQLLAPLFACPSLRYLIIAGEPGGGATGAREDWERLSPRKSPYLSPFCRGRTGPACHQVTIFCGLREKAVA